MSSLKRESALCRLVFITCLAFPALLPKAAWASVASSDPSPPQEATDQTPLPPTTVPPFGDSVESGTIEPPPVPEMPPTPQAPTHLVDRSDEVEADTAASKEIIVAPAEAAAELTVGSGCTYATITAAITAASPGDRLLIEGGVTFNENLVVDKTLTLQGGYDGCASASTSATTIHGGGSASSVLGIYGGTVTLHNLRLTGGSMIGAGVGAHSPSQVTLDNVELTANHGTYGGGLYVAPSAVVTLTRGSKVHQNTASVAGGGARVWGRLVSLDTLSDINNNTAPYGGGVSVVGGELLLVDADLSGNRATDPAGTGGAIHLAGGAVVTMTQNVWLYGGNQAYDGAGIYADNSQVFLGEATIGGNVAAHWGGGIYLTNGSTLSASNAKVGSALAQGNQALSGAGIYASSSTVDFAGSVHSNTAAYMGAGIYADASTFTLTGAHVGGTGANEGNQLGLDGHIGVGLYLSNGTRAALSESVIAGNIFQTAGYAYGGGAFLAGGSVLTLTTSSLENHVAPSVTDGRGAGIYANDSTVTLDDSDVLTNTAGTAGGGLRLFNGATLNILNNSQIVNNHALNGEGGAIAAGDASDINIADATLRENTAGGDGGAIYTNGGTLDLTAGWVLRQNTAGRSGGAVAVVGNAVASFTAGAYSLVYANRAEGGHGGMVYLGNTSTTRLQATAGSQMYLYANYASENGGALYAENGGDFDVYGQISFDRNRADNGGAIYLSNGSGVWLDDYIDVHPQLWDNRADNGSGGAIYAVDSPRIECDGATFGRTDEGNRASVSGGAIYLSGSTFDADNCVFEGNQAGQHGGAIAGYDATLTIHASYPAITATAEPSPLEREAVGPAAVTSTPCDPLAGQCSALYGNMADSDDDSTGDGGAIYVSDSTLNVDQTYLHRNSATRGGAIYQAGTDAAAEVANSLIYGNEVGQQWGAGIRRSSGAFTVIHTTLANNVGGSGFSGVASAVLNTVAWGDGTYPGFSVAPLVAECNIDDGGNAGLNVDPQFVAPGAGENYRLGGGSPAIDACADGLTLDLDGVARPVGSGYDMGAYEYAGHSVFLPLVIRGN